MVVIVVIREEEEEEEERKEIKGKAVIQQSRDCQMWI